MADKPTPCCSDMAEAERDEVIQRHPVVSVAIVTAKGLVPIPFCPWCRTEQPRTLYTSPAMLYRP